MGNCDPYSDSPEPAVVDKPQSTRVEEPTLLCNHLPLAGIPHGRFRRYQALDVLGEAKLGSDAVCEAAPTACAVVICFASCIGSSNVLELGTNRKSAPFPAR
jgi:hypothetical protein